MKYLFYLLTLILAACKTPQSESESVYMRQIHGNNEVLAYIYVDNESGKQGLLDTNNNIILKAQFDHIEDWQRYGLVLVDSGGRRIDGGDYIAYEYNKYGVITAGGKILFRPQFDDARIGFESVMVKKDSLWGYIDKNGGWIEKPRFKEAFPFYYETAIVKDNGYFYLINKQGKQVIEMAFDTIWGFKNDVSVVVKDNRYGFINHSGKFILPMDNYSGIGEYNWYHGQFMKYNKWFVIDTAGNLPISYGFDEVSIHEEGDKIYAKGTVNGKKRKVELQ